MQTFLSQVPFRDVERARQTSEALEHFLGAEVARRLRALVLSSPDPDQTLHYFQRLLDERPEALLRLGTSPGGLQAMAAVFGNSRFLSEAITRNPEWLEELLHTHDLDSVLTTDQLEWRLENYLNTETSGPPSPEHLARFRRQQLLRIVIKDVYELAGVAEVTEELSNLADAILRVTYQRIYLELERRFGTPVIHSEGGATEPCGMCVIALGKLGGRELNYSSDIDLMFFYQGSGQTSGSDSISNKEFFQKLSHLLCDTLSTYTAEGMCYRVDLRLRPEGRIGEICISLDAAKAYYKNRARDWELQMLLKARSAAGDSRLGNEFLEFVGPLIYSTTLDFSKVEAVSETRHRIQEKASLAIRGPKRLDVKLEPGGIRDIEFLVQCLQRLHGGRDKWIRHAGTLLALFRLREKEFLSAGEYAVLADAYQFLRNVEHRLQFDQDRQVHTLPEDGWQRDSLARKMPPEDGSLIPGWEVFEKHLQAHLAGVLAIHERVIHAQQSAYFTEEGPRNLSPMPVVAEAEKLDDRPLPQLATNAIRFLDQKAPAAAEQLRKHPLRRGHRYLEVFAERLVDQPRWLAMLDAYPAVLGDVMNLFELSPYFSEQLVRRFDFLSELMAMRNPVDAHLPYTDLVSVLDETAELRTFYHRELFRILAESLILDRPIFETLKHCSELADAAIQAVYRIAIADTLEKQRPASVRYEPRDQMMVIAMGRLGMLEFDLGSDADLLFVLSPEDAEERPFWRSVAQRMINLLSSYTADGTIFAVDTRLRPDGSSGSLVQTEESYRAYFETRAEAWEGLAFMKSRRVAGDPELTKRFLGEIQRSVWRRHGQSERSRIDLAAMRARLEQEQGDENPLKSGRGGFYDIDFSLLYLRLRSAGVFYPVLNTLERIDVVEQMGHVERADAEFLRDAATFYRAVDHGLRLSTGRAQGDLPKSSAQLERLLELVQKWTPHHLHDQPLELELAQIQERTSAFFHQLFRL